MSGQATVLRQRDGRISVITLDRPTVINAINPTMRDELLDALSAAESDTSVHAVVIRGAGERGFCAGADLKAVANMQGEEMRRFVESCWQLNQRIATSPLPVVVALHGFVLGGGLELALACDLRFASESTVFGLPEVPLGSVPAFGGMQRLAGIVGATRAAELAFTGRRFGAAEAASYGLLNEVTAPGQLDATTMATAQLVASQSREALRYAKAALTAPLDTRIAPLFHGLLSETTHRSADYHKPTNRFS